MPAHHGPLCFSFAKAASWLPGSVLLVIREATKDWWAQRYKYSISLTSDGPALKCDPHLSRFSGGLGQTFLCGTLLDSLLTPPLPSLTSPPPYQCYLGNFLTSHTHTSRVCFWGTKVTVLTACILKLWGQVLILIQAVALGKLSNLSEFVFLHL